MPAHRQVKYIEWQQPLFLFEIFLFFAWKFDDDDNNNGFASHPNVHDNIFAADADADVVEFSTIHKHMYAWFCTLCILNG